MGAATGSGSGTNEREIDETESFGLLPDSITKLKKAAIKIIKRKDAEAKKAARGLALRSLATTSISQPASEKAEALTRRQLDSTVMRWILERRESGRIERIAAVKVLDGQPS